MRITSWSGQKPSPEKPKSWPVSSFGKGSDGYTLDTLRIILPLVLCLAGIVYALSDRAQWNSWFNPGLDAEAVAGGTNWLTIGALVLSLLVGTVAFMGSLAFGIQRYFEYQIEEARKISQ